MKRVFSLVFAVLLLVMCAVSVSAAATEPQYIYFRVPTEGNVSWNNFRQVYCHIWSKTDGDIYSWQSKKEACEDLENGYWRYDMSALSFDPEGEYSLIFSNENGFQTYNLNVTSSCLGDIAVCAGDTSVNPVDGEKSCAVARWLNNGDKVYPAIEVDSNGMTINVDGVDPADIETVWGDNAGASYELEEIVTADKDADAEPEDAVTTIGADTAENADKLDTSVVTMWIIICCSVLGVAIVITVIILARKNRKKG